MLGVDSRRAHRHPSAGCDRSLEPTLEFLRAIPPPVLVPILMLIAGIDDLMKVIVIISGAIWPILLNTVEGVRGADEVLDDTCRSYRIRGGLRLRHFVLRSASPQIVTGARQALAIALILMVISEMFAANNGLGYLDRPVPARLPDRRRCGAASCCSASSAWCSRCSSGSSRGGS